MTARCHALLCDDPYGGPEPTANLHGMSAHPDCVPARERLNDMIDQFIADRPTPRSWVQRPESEPEWSWVAWVFGPGVRLTERGRVVARVFIALLLLVSILVFTWMLDSTADTIVDPTPELPADEGIQT